MTARLLFLIGVAAVAAAAGAYYAYKNVTRDKYSVGLVVLRALTFTALAFIFLRPVLNISTVLPQESYLAVLLDNISAVKIRRGSTDEPQESAVSQPFASAAWAASIRLRAPVLPMAEDR